MTSHMDALLDSLMCEADTLLQGLFGNTLIGVYILRDNHFVYVNQRLSEMCGYSQEELCTGAVNLMDMALPEDRPLVAREMESRLRGEPGASIYSFRGQRKDGSLIHVEGYGTATRFDGQPAIIGIVLDVSERSAAERAVADQLQFIQKLLDTIPSPVFFKDEEGRYLGCNTAFEHYLGWERARLIGCSVYDIAPKALADIYASADKALFAAPGTQTYESTVAFADGSQRDVVLYKATFNKADGGLGGLVGVMLDISERKRMEDLIWQEANYDSLTGLPNRRLLRDRLCEELKRAERKDSKLALLFIDLDRFKDVNDTLGHDVGDRLLVMAAQRIRSAVRAADTVSRQGGDEFVIILPDMSDTEKARRVAQEVIHRLALPYDFDGQLAYVTASIGIASYPDDCRDLETLVRYADQAMYAAKAVGRNCYCHFTPSMQALALQRLEIHNDLRRAVVEQQFEVYYQPIVDLVSDRTVKAEALVRWPHATRGQVSPVVFIPLAEEIGLIGEIGNWVFRQAMAAAGVLWARQLAAGHGAQEPLQISVNISPRQLITSSCGDWIAHLRELGLPPQVLAVEITEGLLLDNRGVVVDALLAFLNAGVQISIDDFGTGYSALSYLKKFDIDYLKIDRTFVRDLTTDPSDLAISKAVIAMAHSLGIKVIAEGVETEAQRDLLRTAGCDYAQGYLFARPMPLADFLRFVA